MTDKAKLAAYRKAVKNVISNTGYWHRTIKALLNDINAEYRRLIRQKRGKG
jgi:hypothetical protein